MELWLLEAEWLLRTLEQEQLLGRLQGRLHMLQQELPLRWLAPPHTVSLFMLPRELAKQSLSRAPEQLLGTKLQLH